MSAWSDTITLESVHVPASLSLGKVIARVPVAEAAGVTVATPVRRVPPDGLRNDTDTDATPEAGPPLSPASVALKFRLTTSELEVVLIEPLKLSEVRFGGVVSTAELTVKVPRFGKAALTAAGPFRNSNPLASSANTYATL